MNQFLYMIYSIQYADGAGDLKHCIFNLKIAAAAAAVVIVVEVVNRVE